MCGFGSVAAGCLGEGKVGSLLAAPLHTNCAEHYRPLWYFFLWSSKCGNSPVRLVLLAHTGGECLALWLKKAPWHCCSLECNEWFRVAEPSGNAPIPLLHNWNTLPALLFNGIFGSQWYIWIQSPFKLLHQYSGSVLCFYYAILCFLCFVEPKYLWILTHISEWCQDAINI